MNTTPRPSALEPIRVTYNNVTYRSALEADWAATFTHLGIYFQYEPEAYRTASGGQYHPDFYLPNQHMYCEAKGPHNDRIEKPRELAAVLAANEFPHAYMVAILRPAGPHGGIVWESAGSTDLKFGHCAGCEYHAFAWYDNAAWGGEWVCRQCGGVNQLATPYVPDDGSFGAYLTMQHAPRWAGAA